MLKNYITVTVRNLFKHPLFTIINIGGLSIGIACCIFIFLYVDNELSYDKFHANAQHIFRVTTLQNNAGKRDAIATTPSPLAATLIKDLPFVKQTVRIGKWYANFKSGEEVVEERNIYAVDPSFLSMFSFPMKTGNALTALSSKDAIVITEKTAEKYFGTDWQSSNVIGKTITAKPPANNFTFSVQALLLNIPSNSTLQFDFLLPFTFLQTFDNSENQWNYSSYYTYFLTDGSVSLPALNDAVRNQVLHYEKASSALLQVQSLTDIYLHSDFAFNSELVVTGSLAYVTTFSVIGFIILLLACINFVNLTTARSLKRAKEIGLRKTIGASRSQLIYQFMLEAGIVCMVALAFAFLLVRLLFPYFNAISGREISFHFTAYYLIALFVFYLAVVLLSGCYPAFFLSSFGASKVIKGVFAGDKSKRFRQAMMLVQFTISVVMMIGAVIVSQQLHYIQTKDLGFDKSQLMYVKLQGPEAKKNYNLLRNDIRQEADIENISAATANLVDVTNGGDIEWQGMKSGDNFSITQMTVDENFLAVTGMKLAQGRNFSAGISSDSTTFIINQAAADRMNYGKDAINKKLSFWNVDGRIIGVVKDFNYQPLTMSVQPLVLRYRPDEWHFTLLIKTKPNQVQATIQTIQKLYKKYDGDAAFAYGFVDQALNKLYTAQQQAGAIINWFTGLAIFISCMGLFGLVAYTIEQRTKEISIRKILGAGMSAIIILLCNDFMWLIYLSLVIASPVAYYFASQWLQGFVYRIDINGWQFAIVGGSVIVLALFIISFQSIKAAIANPAKNLQVE